MRLYIHGADALLSLHFVDVLRNLVTKNVTRRYPCYQVMQRCLETSFIFL